MAGAFKRSWDLTKITLEVIKKDKELIVFPILAGLFSFIFFIAMVFPIILSPLLLKGSPGMNIVANWLIVLLIYLGLAFIATFFNVCVVYTAKKRFEGGSATFIESIKFSFSKFHLIFIWSIVAAIVGLILRIISGRRNFFGNIISSILGGAWALLTIFVVPGMVYHGYSPMDAIKNSAETFRKTWGENLIRVFGFGLAQFVFFIIGIVAGILLIFTSISLGSTAMLIISIVILAIYFMAMISLFSIASMVYSTALYVYSEQGKVPAGFTREVLSSAFSEKER